MWPLKYLLEVFIEIIIDSNAIVKILQRGHMYPSPCFPQWYHLTSP